MSYDDEVAYNLRDGRILRALLWRLQGGALDFRLLLQNPLR